MYSTFMAHVSYSSFFQVRKFCINCVLRTVVCVILLEIAVETSCFVSLRVRRLNTGSELTRVHSSDVEGKREFGDGDGIENVSSGSDVFDAKLSLGSRIFKPRRMSSESMTPEIFKHLAESKEE
ncbi:hypothetical protein Tco_1301772 [Tanacetum coccineum]